MLKAALHAVTAQLRKLRGRAAARGARPRAATACSGAQWRTLCSLCAAKDGDTTIAAACLRHVHGGKMAATACETLLQKVQTWWVRSSAADRTAWARAPRTRAESLAVAAARASFHASTLHSGIEGPNFRKGIAPTSRGLLHLLRKHATSQSCASTHVPQRKSQFQWLRRWRTRWHVKLARIAAREHIPDGVPRSKAPAGHGQISHSAWLLRLFLSASKLHAASTRGKKMRPTRRPCFWTRGVGRARGAHSLVPKFGPPFSQGYTGFSSSRPSCSGLGAPSSMAAAPPPSAISK